MAGIQTDLTNDDDLITSILIKPVSALARFILLNAVHDSIVCNTDLTERLSVTKDSILIFG